MADAIALPSSSPRFMANVNTVDVCRRQHRHSPPVPLSILHPSFTIDHAPTPLINFYHSSPIYHHSSTITHLPSLIWRLDPPKLLIMDAATDDAKDDVRGLHARGERPRVSRNQPRGVKRTEE